MLEGTWKYAGVPEDVCSVNLKIQTYDKANTWICIVKVVIVTFQQENKRNW